MDNSGTQKVGAEAAFVQKGKRPRVLHAVTSAMGLCLMRGQPEFLRQAGFEVTLISAPASDQERTFSPEDACWVTVAIQREIAPFQDLRALWHLWRLMRRVRPDLTNVSTPKGGLLGGIAAWLTGVPCRFYTLRGLRLETSAGWRHRVLLLWERVACRCAHRVICVSESVRGKAVASGLVAAADAVVLGTGSSNGVDAKRFAPTPQLLARAAKVRKDCGIPADAPVVGFVGRLTRDKGLVELVAAYSQLSERFPALRLMLVGEFEDGDPVPENLRRRVETDPQIVHARFAADPAPWYHAMDVLALPSHREGFPNVVLEAGAAGKPVVAAAATGTVDAVLDGVTGRLIPVGDARALAKALAALLTNKPLAAAMGRAGRERVLREFRPEIIWSALVGEYRRMLEARGLVSQETAARKQGKPLAMVIGANS